MQILTTGHNTLLVRLAVSCNELFVTLPSKATYIVVFVGLLLLAIFVVKKLAQKKSIADILVRRPSVGVAKGVDDSSDAVCKHKNLFSKAFLASVNEDRISQKRKIHDTVRPLESRMSMFPFWLVSKLFLMMSMLALPASTYLVVPWYPSRSSISIPRRRTAAQYESQQVS